MILYSLYLILFVIIIATQIDLRQSYNQKLVGNKLQNIDFQIPNRYMIFYDTSETAKINYIVIL